MADAIQGSAYLAGLLQTIRTVSEDGVCPIDSSAMEECDAMMTAINRLLFEQESHLRHIQAMRSARSKFEKVLLLAKEESNVSQAI